MRFLAVLFVLSVILQCSSAARFSSMMYPATSVRKYLHPWRYVPRHGWPRSMQRRFMWKEMDDTVDGLMGGVSTGARTMSHMFNPSVIRYRKPIDFDSQTTANVKYVIKKPPSPTFKRVKMMKLQTPKKPLQMYSSPVMDIPMSIPSKPNFVPFMSAEDLRRLEKEQEKRVENEHNNSFHEHSHQSHMDDDVVSGRINEFGEGWQPVQAPHSTQKPVALSQLHTKVVVGTTAPPPTPPPPPMTTPYQSYSMQSQKDTGSYEVTEYSAEESVRSEEAFKPSNHFDFLTSAAPTTESPNYPEYFLKNIEKIEGHFPPKRIHLPLPTTTTHATTTSTIGSTTFSNRLPPRATTERPFKRYNLHRPKSSKLFFSRSSSLPEPAKSVRTTTTTTTEQSIRVISEPFSMIREPIRTTRESIKTTREPIRTTREPIKTTFEPLRTTREPIKTTRESIKTTFDPLRTTREPAKAPIESVRTVRSDLEIKKRARNKNILVSQNEGLNKMLNRSRGTVRFGENQS